LSEKKRIVCISGARPNFMKIAPLLRAMEDRPHIETILVHTGQHYDDEMSGNFFRDLGMRPPDVDLEGGSASHAVQTGTVMIRFDEFLDRTRVDRVVVVGDVNSTIACAVTAVKRGIPVAHVEAGLRSFDRAMPEEVNRVLTDSISDLLFTTEADGEKNLIAEGIPPGRIHFIGNVMVDSLFHHREEAKRIEPPCPLPERFGLVTLHRPSNVDRKEDLEKVASILVEISESLPLLFPIHPRTSRKLEEFNLKNRIDEASSIVVLPPLGYIDFLRLMMDASLILTDSGGIQEESTALGIPCITMRENTERPITVEEGTNEVCGTDREKINRVLRDVLEGRGKKGRVPEWWDGKSADRFAAIVEQSL